MAFPLASNMPNLSGTFIPTLWAGKLVEKLYDACVVPQIANTDYQGEISDMGDKVIIRTIPTVTIRDYSAGQALQVERPDSPIVTLNIDQGRYFNLILDDVMDIQSDINLMDTWAADAAQQMKINIDRYVLANVVADSLIPTANKGTTAGRISANINLGTTGAPVQITKTNAIDNILNYGQVLDEQNVPEQGRFLVLPPAYIKLLKASDLKDASLTGDGASVLRNGRIGMIDRFTVYSSNLLPRPTDGSFAPTYALAGVKMGLTFAMQIAKVESLRAESTFGNLMRGLNVFGLKVVKGEALAPAYIYF
jgi:hypothetical protein